MSTDVRRLRELLESGQSHYQAGHTQRAVELYRGALELDPLNADILQTLALWLHRIGQGNEAILLLRKSITLDPNNPGRCLNLGEILIAHGDTTGAYEAFHRAIQLNPNSGEAYRRLAKLLQRLGRPHEAHAAALQSARLTPQSPEALNELGSTQLSLDRLDEAATSFRHAIQLRPQYPDALSNLGNTLWTHGKREEALTFMHQAALARPRDPHPLFTLGNALYSLCRYRQAADAFRRTIALLPDSPEAWGNYSTALLALDEFDESIAAARKVVQLKPDDAMAYYNLGTTLRRANRREEAEDVYRRCIALDPKFGVAYGNLAICVAELGRVEEAIGLYQTAMSLTDESWVAESFTYMLYFLPGQTPASILREHRKWNDRYVKPLATRPRFQNDVDPDRRLRIGYVSACFYSHCQSFFTVPLFANHDRSNVEVFCYSNSTHEDQVTQELRRRTDVWRNVAHSDDATLAGLIRADRIDVLIDCSMHMQNHRLFTFALRAAPVQTCWLAYPGTTGLAEMDYRISDPYLDPPGSDSMSTEKTIRLRNSFWCYDPLTAEPRVNELPALSQGYITFGCLNNFLKLNTLTLDVWSRVLRALPTSRLLLLTEPGKARQRVHENLSASGIASHRIEFLDRMPRAEYLRCYNRFDLSIDTFPYNGHTTTLDSLWMGVPPLTAPGHTTVSRGGLGILSNLGLAGLAATDLESLPRKAAELASDLPRLAALRASLRDNMRRSPLTDGPRFARDMESAYRHMWRRWCQTQRP
jgi:predicted O-linked N-acetylglucosamine transferase (SPINDLY family)